MDDSFGQRINDALTARGWSQKRLEIRSGVSQQHISQIVNGERKPGITTVVKLARALGVSLDWLAGLPPREPAQLEPAEEELVAAYRALDEAHRKVVLGLARGLGGSK